MILSDSGFKTHCVGRCTYETTRVVTLSDDTPEADVESLCADLRSRLYGQTVEVKRTTTSSGHEVRAYSLVDSSD